MMYRYFGAAAILALAACNAAGGSAEEGGEAVQNSPDSDAAGAETVETTRPAVDAGGERSEAKPADTPFTAEALGDFNEPWAMTFLPDGRLLVTERPGTLKVARIEDGALRTGDVSGVPAVDYGGQGGLGDIIVHPDFAENNVVYLSYAEAGDGDTRGAALARATLDCAQPLECSLNGLQVIWRQDPKVEGRGHYGHRLAFGPDGKLWITSGERQKFDPAQDMQQNLGKIIRLNADGSVPADNPFAGEGGVTAQIWSLGHRNPLGIAFAGDGTLWTHEMGPKGGDELNIIERGANYGYPEVSNGVHYDGGDIPDHDTRPEFNAPETWWDPVISPAGFVIYSGDAYPDWQDTGLIGGLSSQAIVQVSLEGANSREIARYDMGQRIRELEQGPDGLVYVLEDERDGSGGRLLKLTPKP